MIDGILFNTTANKNDRLCRTCTVDTTLLVLMLSFVIRDAWTLKEQFRGRRICFVATPPASGGDRGHEIVVSFNSFGRIMNDDDISRSWQIVSARYWSLRQRRRHGCRLAAKRR